MARASKRVVAFVVASVLFAAGGCASLLTLDDYGGAPSVAADGGDGGDSPLDGSDGGDGAAVNGCRSIDATFCVDFESEASITGAVWSTVENNPNGDAGVIALTTESWESPPQAASFAVPESSPSCSYLRVTRRFVGDYSRIVTRFAVRAETEGVFFVLTAGSSAPGTYYQLLLSLDKGPKAKLQFQRVADGGVSELGPVEPGLPISALGRWIVVEIDIVEADGTIAATVDGVAANALSVPSDFLVSSPTISLGPWCTAGAMRLLIDDVAATVIE